MAETLRIVIADDELDTREFLSESLSRMGHAVVAAVQDGRQLVAACQDTSPDLVITDIRMPHMDGLDAAAAIYKQRPVPIIVVTAHHDREFVQRASERHVLGFLVKPIKEVDLPPAVAIVRQRFEEFETLKAENESLAQALEDRKVIERAKGILMKQAQLDEPDAFRRLQKLARDQRKRLADVARMIVLSAEALKP
jgi:response regulator NasT